MTRSPLRYELFEAPDSAEPFGSLRVWDLPAFLRSAGRSFSPALRAALERDLYRKGSTYLAIHPDTDLARSVGRRGVIIRRPELASVRPYR